MLGDIILADAVGSRTLIRFYCLVRMMSGLGWSIEQRNWPHR